MNLQVVPDTLFTGCDWQSPGYGRAREETLGALKLTDVARLRFAKVSDFFKQNKGFGFCFHLTISLNPITLYPRVPMDLGHL